MRDIYLGVVNKRLNSTFKPPYLSMDRYSVVFKEGFSYEDPVVILSHEGALPWYNYMYIPDIATYFWVDEKKALQNGRWQITAHVDTLATYRDAIKATSAFIEYGFNANLGADATRIPDHRISVSQRPITTVTEFDFLNDLLDTANGAYILSAVGASDGVQNYVCTKDQIKGIVSSINNDIATAMSGLNTTEDILKYFSINSLAQGSAMSAIKSCIWLPFKVGKIGAGARNIYLGDFDTKVTALGVAFPMYKTLSSAALTWDANDWKRYNTQILIYAPFMGTVALPIDQCNNTSMIWVSYSFDILSGNVACMLKADDYIFYVGSANVASTYAIGSSNVPIQNFASGTITAVGGAIKAGGGVAGVLNPLSDKANAAAAVAGGVGDIVSGTMQSMTPVVQCAGTMSGAAAVGIDQKSKIIRVYYPTIGEAAIQSVYGYPVMQVATPVQGYCKTRGFSVNNARGTAAELAEVNAFMDSGVFIE